MKKHYTLFILLLQCCLGSLYARLSSVSPAATTSRMPLLFVENRGQVRLGYGAGGEAVLFTLPQEGLSLFLTATGIHYQFRREEAGSLGKTHRFSLTLAGASRPAAICKERRSKASYNYYLDGSPGLTGVAAYEKIVYKEVYPHIDWVLYTKDNRLKYDFVVHPGGRPEDIRLQFSDADEVRMTEAGGLLLQSRLGEVREDKPVSFCGTQEVPSAFRFYPDGTVGFDVEALPGQTLTIDPAVVWSTYYGGTGQEQLNAARADGQGNLYIAGSTQSAAGIAMGGYQPAAGGGDDAFLAKFDTSGYLLWATYYGGSGPDQAIGLTADAAGNVFIAGRTTSAGMASSGAFQTTINGTADAFLAKFDASGARLWATYYGDPGADNVYMNCVSADTAGNLYFTKKAQPAPANDVLAKFNSAGTPVWTTYYGVGSGGWPSCSVDREGNIFMAGGSQGLPGQSNSAVASGGFQTTFGGNVDGYLVKFSPAGLRLWSTLYGGSGSDQVTFCTTDKKGNVFIGGETSTTTPSNVIASGGFQNTSGGSIDAFLVKFSPSGARLWGTYYGGNGTDRFQSGFADDSGHVYVSGFSNSASGIAGGGFQNTMAGGGDAVMVKFDSLGGRVWGSYFGGTGLESISACTGDAAGRHLYLTGYTSSTAGIALPGTYQKNLAGGFFDAYLVKLGDTGLFTDTTLSGTLCAGAPLNVSYTLFGTYNNGNIFTAQLSDASGSFASPVGIGTLNAVTAGTISAVIPAGTPQGAGYRIRVVSSNPAMIAPNNDHNLAIDNCCVPDALTVTEMICSNQLPFTWHGISLSAGGTAVASDTFTNTGGCDSVVFLDLLVHPQPAPVTVYDTVCSNQLPYTWNGITVTAAGPAAAVFTTANAAGCDSVVTLNLSVNPASAHTEVVTVCSNQLPYTWNSIAVTSGGAAAAIFTTTNAAGCDSVVTLDLTVNNAGAYTETIEICTSGLPYVWNGITVAAGGAGVATYTTANAQNCDSTVTLNLLVTPTVAPSVSITANPGTTITGGTPVTFTALPVNGGTVPVLQWKKNGLTVGTNSTTYTDIDLDDGDIITCTLWSNAACAAPDSATSNEIGMTVIVPPVPCEVPLTLISTDIQLTSATFRWAAVPGAAGYEYKLDIFPADPASGAFTTDTLYQAAALNPGMHYFHIRTRCAGGRLSPWITIKIEISDAGATGINGPSLSGSRLELYPNPNNGMFHIRGDVQGSSTEIDVLDRAGRILYRRSLSTPGGKLENRIDLKDRLEPGVYLVRVFSGNQVAAIRFYYH